MSQDSTNAVWAAIRQRLRADATVAALVGNRIYDRPMQDVQFDWIQLDDSQALPWHVGCGAGVELYLTIRIWVRGDWPGDKCRDIAAAVMASLHRQKFLVVGHDLQLIEHQDTNVIRDPDGTTRQGIMTFRAYTTAA